MRRTGVSLLAVLLGVALAGDPVGDEQAKNALKDFEAAFKTKELEAKQNAVYNLHDVPHDLVLKRLEKLLRDRNPEIRNVAALALGGQGHDVAKAGTTLMKAYEKNFETTVVVSSVLEGMAELKFLGYWPQVEPALKDERSSIVIRVLDLLGTNGDWRSLPRLLEMYKVALPKRVSWKTGEVKVDTGAAGDADAEAARAEFNRRYGSGGSKEKAKAKAKARAFDERNFSVPLRRTVKKITGEDFENSIDFEAWYVKNYVMVMRKIAEMEGKDLDAAERKARGELPALKAAHEEEIKRLEEESKAEREQGN